MTAKLAALERLLARPIAHRGLHGCGRPEAPVENTIGAAQAAIAAGFGVECDVQLAADGEVIVFHDARLERLTTGEGDVRALTSRELAELGLRSRTDRIPTLADFLRTIDGGAPLVIEMKTFADGAALARRVLSLLGGYRGVAAVESFDADVVAACLAGAAPCPVGLVGPPESGEDVDADLCRRCDFLSWNIDHLAGIAARRLGVPLTTWTVRNPEQQETAAAFDAQIVFERFRPARSDPTDYPPSTGSMRASPRP